MSQPVIRVLDENTANKIAAGEVVERPASVVKELVENSLDAYSRNIEVTIADGGATFIRVADDGIGMSAQDAQLAVLRHATSKISSVEDLYSVNSLGFRGEALPSIASVSRFSLLTRLHDEHLATYVEVTGGVVGDVREAGGNVGTVITVADLFFNTPARRKFMKTATTESGYIHDIVGKLALSHPEVAFKLVNNDRLVLSTPGTGSLLDALASLYGPKIPNEMLPVTHSDEGLTISGFVAKPTLIKSSRQWQTFLVNGRIINSRLVAKALDNAYHSLLPKAGYPLAVLNISLPPDALDVNVHPQKTEIKFSDESRLFRAVYHAVSDLLSTPGRGTEAIAASVTGPVRYEIAEVKPAPTPIPTRLWQDEKREPAPARSWNMTNTAPPAVWREDPVPFSSIRAALEKETDLPGVSTVQETEQNTNANIDILPLGQIDNCYIAAQGPDGLYIIDQHAAHERILYDKLSLAAGRIPVQPLLVPLFLDFDSRETRLFTDNLEVFFELGFTLEQVGPNSLRLTEAPADVPLGEVREFLQETLSLIQNTANPTPAALRHAYLQTAACRAAIKAGDNLNMRQMQALVNELCATTLPYTCPHGRPTIIKFTPGELAKMFKRT